MASEHAALFRSAPALLAAALALSAAGCNTAPFGKVPPVVSAPDQEFWDRLPQAKRVSEDDASRALLEFAGVACKDAPDVRHATLQAHGWLAADDRARPDQPATAGRVAGVLCRMLQIRGGATMRVVGVNARYATRELVHLGILPRDMQPGHQLSGAELTRILGLAERHREHAAR